jgi:hypothetical protein
MINIKKISLLTLLSSMSLIYGLSEQNYQFKPYATDKFMYTITATADSMQTDDAQLTEPIIISDKTHKNYFNNGIVRIKVTQATQAHAIITTTETWTTKNPSYATWTNIVFISALIAGTATGLYYNHLHEYDKNCEFMKAIDKYAASARYLKCYRTDVKQELKDKTKKDMDNNLEFIKQSARSINPNSTNHHYISYKSPLEQAQQLNLPEVQALLEPK